MEHHEAALEQRLGWGVAPTLAMIEQTSSHSLRIRPVPARITEPQGQTMLALGVVFNTMPDKVKNIVKRHPGIVAMTFIAEYWGTRNLDPSITEDTVHEQPDAKALRQVLAVDIWGRLFTVKREQGGVALAQQTMFRGGRILIGLTGIVRGMANYLPNADKDAIDKLMDSFDPDVYADAVEIGAATWR